METLCEEICNIPVIANHIVSCTDELVIARENLSTSSSSPFATPISSPLTPGSTDLAFNSLSSPPNLSTLDSDLQEFFDGSFKMYTLYSLLSRIMFMNKNCITAWRHFGGIGDAITQIKTRQHTDIIRHLVIRILTSASTHTILDEAELDLLDDEFFHCLYASIESTRDDTLESINFDTIHLLVSLHHQFLLSLSDGSTTPNRPLQVLATRIDQSKTLSENLIFILNRETNIPSKIIILEFIYELFQPNRSPVIIPTKTPSSSPSSSSPLTLSQFFFTNDIQVLVDLLLRDLESLRAFATQTNIDAETMRLMMACLKVLPGLLLFSQYRMISGDVAYKSRELKDVLETLVRISSNTGNNMVQHRQTLSLMNEDVEEVGRVCRRVLWKGREFFK